VAVCFARAVAAFFMCAIFRFLFVRMPQRKAGANLQVFSFEKNATQKVTNAGIPDIIHSSQVSEH
jgi:hypothetical protein